MVVVKGLIDFIHQDKVLIQATVSHHNVATLDGNIQIQVQTAMSATVDRPLLHRRFCHISRDRLEQVIREKLSTNLKLTSDTPCPALCETCIIGKQHRAPFPQLATDRHLQPLDLVVSDVHGPLPVSTAQRYRYWVLFLDMGSRLYTTYLMKHKSDTFTCFKEYKAWAETQFERKIKVFRDDKGGECMSTDMAKYLKEHGIQREHTARATPQQNGAAERGNRTMAEGVTCMLSEARLPLSFWGEVLATFVYVRNRLPTAALPSTTIPFAAFGRKPSLQHVRVFGCRAYVLIQKDQKKSLQPHSVACIFLGYSDEIKGWRCYNPVTKKVIVSRDVIFNEGEYPGLSTKSVLSGVPVSLTLDGNKVLLPAEDPDDDDIAPVPAPAPAPAPEPAPPLPPAPPAAPEPESEDEDNVPAQPDKAAPAPPPVPVHIPEPCWQKAKV